MSLLRDCSWSKDSNLWAKIWSSTFCWHARHCPAADLFDTASICMYALLTRALLTFATLTELNRSESLAPLTELPTLLVSGLLVAASDVKGCLSHLCVLGSLAGSQAAAIVV